MGWIHQHGTLQRVCKSEARRYGWDAVCVNRDVDPIDSILCLKADPGRGDIELTRDRSRMTFEYHLPEEEAEIRKEIRALVKGEQMDSDRRANPANAASPIELTGA